MRDYPILHLKQNKVNEHERLSNITLETKESKGTWETIQYYTWREIKQRHMRDYPILHLKGNKAKPHARLSNITLRHKFM
jgi:hypothetical protein